MFVLNEAILTGHYVYEKTEMLSLTVFTKDGPNSCFSV